MTTDNHLFDFNTIICAKKENIYTFYGRNMEKVAAVMEHYQQKVIKRGEFISYDINDIDLVFPRLVKCGYKVAVIEAVEN